MLIWRSRSFVNWCVHAYWAWMIVGISLTAVHGLDKHTVLHWTPFKPTGIRFDYVSGEVRQGKQRLWLATRSQNDKQHAMVINQPAKGGRATVAFTTALMQNFPTQHTSEQPVLNLSRTSVYHYEQRGYVCIASAFAGASYRPGKHPLLPVLFSSPTGEPNTWAYHGRLAGEPTDYEATKRVWSDNGGIVPIAGGRWRAYLNGYGVTLAACEADDLAGPWTFIRGADGSISNLARAFVPTQAGNGGGIFPFVLRVSPREYHLWLSQHWPVQAIWHFTSPDGLTFEPYGQQPEIVRPKGAPALKGVRAFLSSDKKTIHGWAPFWTNKRWEIHAATMPVGLHP